MSRLTRFVVLSYQRSGSTWLMDLLNSHEAIGAYEECFHADDGEGRSGTSPDRPEALVPPRRFDQYRADCRGVRPAIVHSYLDALEAWSRPCEVVGFKLMYDQLWRFPELVPLLVLRRYRAIHLVRENHLDCVLSVLTGRKRKIAHSRRRVEQVTVRVDPHDALKKMRRMERKKRGMEGLLRCLPVRHVRITYEALRADTRAYTARLHSFLGVAETGVTAGSTLIKLNVRPRADIVENYDELQRALTGTRFARLLSS